MNYIITAVGIMKILQHKLGDFDITELPDHYLENVTSVSNKLIEMSYAGQREWHPEDFDINMVKNLRHVLRTAHVFYAKGHKPKAGFDISRVVAAIVIFVIDGHLEDAQQCLEGCVS